MNAGHRVAKSRPAPPMNQNTGGQPKRWLIHPINGVNSTVAEYCAELKIALARPRSAVGNHAATIRALPGKDGDSATPRRKRSTKSVKIAAAGPSPPMKPCKLVNSDHS